MTITSQYSEIHFYMKCVFYSQREILLHRHFYYSSKLQKTNTIFLPHRQNKCLLCVSECFSRLRSKGAYMSEIEWAISSPPPPSASH